MLKHVFLENIMQRKKYCWLALCLHLIVLHKIAAILANETSRPRCREHQIRDIVNMSSEKSPPLVLPFLRSIQNKSA